MSSDISFNPLDREFLQNPFPFFKTARKDFPVYRHAPQLFQHVSLFCHDDIKKALWHWKEFSNDLGDDYRDAMGGRSMSFMFSDPPFHTQMRALVTQPFLPRVIQQLRPMVEQLTSQLFDQVRSYGDKVEYMRDVADHVPVNAIAMLLGLPKETWSEFKRAADDITSTIGFFTIGSESMPEAVRQKRTAAETVLRDIYESVLDLRLDEPAEDLLSVIAQAEKNGDIDRMDVEGLILLLLQAGHTTTRRFLGSIVVALTDNPGLWSLLKSRPELIPQAVEEVLRYFGPTRLMMRRATDDMEIRGTNVYKNEYVLCWLHSANRDESVFENPESFDITRDNKESLAFGYGRHVCLGRELARLEGIVHIENLLKRVKLIERIEEKVHVAMSPIGYGPDKLPVRIEWI